MTKLLLFFLPVIALAQVNPSQIVFNAVQATAFSGPIQNTGQSAHVVRVLTTNAPTKTCSASSNFTLIVRLEGSWNAAWNGTTWTSGNWADVGTPIVASYVNAADGSIGATRYYSGGYPALRINLQATDTVNCLTSVFYSGSFSGAFDTTTLRASDLGFVTVSNNPVAAAAAISSSVPAGFRIVVYAASIAVGATPAGVFYFGDVTCSGPSYWFAGNLAASAVYTLPMTSRPYFSTPSGANGMSLCSNGSATAMDSVTFRYE